MAERKRARTDSSKPDGITREDYVKELTEEQTRLEGLNYPHTLRLLAAEIQRMAQEESEGDLDASNSQSTGSGMPPGGVAGEGAAAVQAAMADARAELPWERPVDESGIKCVLMPDEQTQGGKQRFSMKIFMPENSHGPSGPFAARGRLLGSKGATLKALQAESRCKMAIKGKGSIKFKPGESEEAHLADPTYAHLHEDFHVLVEYEGTSGERNSTFRTAESLVRTVLSGGTIAQSSGGMGLGHFGGAYGAGYGGGYGVTGIGSLGTEQMAESAVAAGQIMAVMASHADLPGNMCKSSLKVYIPEKTGLGCSRGRILGQRGSTLKQLQAECGCKLTLRGKSSMKINPGESAESLSVTHPHLKEPLHVLVEFDGMVHMRDSALQSAEGLLRSVLTPAAEQPNQGFMVSQYEMIHQHYAPRQHLPTVHNFYNAYPSQPIQQATPYGVGAYPQQPQQPQAFQQQQQMQYGQQQQQQHHQQQQQQQQQLGYPTAW